MANVFLIVSRPLKDQVCDVESSEFSGDLYVTCSAERVDNGDPADWVVAKIYDMAATVPNTPPLDAVALTQDFGYEFYGNVPDCPCKSIMPLPQFRIAFWAGIEDPDTQEITWDTPITREAYGHVHEDLYTL